MLTSNRWMYVPFLIALLMFGDRLQAEARENSAVAVLVVSGLGKGTVPLDGPWQFHVGDERSWANPEFDNSQWEQIDVSKPWGDQGHWNYTGRAWYRRHIAIKDETSGLINVGLYVPIATCAYEVYWNGRLIGRTRAMPGQSAESQPAAAVFNLGAPASGVLAFRAYSPPADTTTPGSGPGLNAQPRVGNVEAITNLAASRRSTVLQSRLLTLIQIVIYGQLLLLSALVWLRNRKQKLLFWMTVFLLSATVWTFQDPVLFPWTQTNILASYMTGGTNHSFQDLALWYLLLYLLNLDGYAPLVRWIRVVAWITLFSAVLDSGVFYMPSIDENARWFQVLDAIFTVGFSAGEVFPFLLIALALRKPMDRARWLVAITAFLSNMYFVVAHTAQQGERFTRWTLYDSMTEPLFRLAGVEVSMQAILNLLLVCAIVYAVYRYMVEQGARQMALEHEFRNARAVQQVLIPDELASIPGFSVSSVYKPYGEVGGDFFQILAAKNGGVLAVIGDVSGKGMPAAMTVSLLVGTLRTLAHYTQSPGEILKAMNQRMLGRSQGGFTTCLVLRADLDGALTIANAGHIAPYLAGEELPLKSGLPLGLSEETTYAESVFRLAPGEQLTLLTDGVVEAREKSGTLFGFERTAALSTQPPAAIAAAAQAFGQDDDITVLSLTLASFEVAHA